MDKDRARSIIESVLFAMGDPVDARTFASVLGMSENETKLLIEEMAAQSQAKESGISIIEIDGGYQMCTKAENYEALIKIVSHPRQARLTDVQLETLSIIAYKQPVTKAQIEEIRGVSCDHAVNRLLEAGLIQECGRLDAPGRAIIFGTTREFLRRFGLKDTGDLPHIDTEKLESFKLEAEEEVGCRDENAPDEPSVNEGTAQISGGSEDEESFPQPGPDDEIIDVEI